MFVVIGTVTADLMVQSDTPLSNLGGDGFRSSNLVFTDAPVTITMGGNGGNSAYVLAGLAAPTALCGAVGQDLLGDTLVSWLVDRQVNLSGLARSVTHATSSSTIIMTGAANQVVFHHLGSTAAASFEEMPTELFDSAQALLISSFPIMPQMRAGGFAQALARVYGAGGITALDVGPAIGNPVTLAELTPLLPMIDYLIANSHELVSLTGDDDWRAATRQLLAAGARCVVIKQGKGGASMWTPNERFTVPAFDVNANISVGAGDAFNVGMLYTLERGGSPQEALRFGNAVAAMIVSGRRGVLDSPSLSQVDEFIDAHPHTGVEAG